VVVATITVVVGITFGSWKPTARSKPPKDATYKTIRDGQLKIRYTDTSSEEQPPQQQSSSTSSSSTTTTLVLVHGFMGCLETWNVLKEHLMSNNKNNNTNNNKVRIIALDLPGDGFSDKPLDGSLEYTFRGQGRALAEFIQEMNLLDDDRNNNNNNNNNKVVLVGHSSGGIVVSAAVKVLHEKHEDNNSMIQGLFFVAPGFFQGSKPKLSNRSKAKLMARSIRKNRPSMLRRIHLDPDAHLREDLVAAFEAAQNAPHAAAALEEFLMGSEEQHPYSEVLTHIHPRQPFHVVWSNEDFVSPPAAEKIQGMIDDGTMTAPFSYALVSGSGHYIQHEKPKELAEEIDKFCKGLETKEEAED
jgi:pimeloyl-ACP methyl ester carboxylesterase